MANEFTKVASICNVRYFMARVETYDEGSCIYLYPVNTEDKSDDDLMQFMQETYNPENSEDITIELIAPDCWWMYLDGVEICTAK